jgi:hypothetical protein
LKEGEHVTGVVIEVSPLPVITGKVMDENGDPVRGIGVRACSHRGSQCAVAGTDDHGEYQLLNFGLGAYYVYTRDYRLPPDPPGGAHSIPRDRAYAADYYPGVDGLSQASLLYVAPGADLNGINFYLKKVPVFHIRGRVDGAAARTKIYVERLHDLPIDSYHAEFSVQPDGAFDARGVPPGLYCVYADERNGDRQTYARQDILVSDHDIESVNLELAPKATIQGSVDSQYAVQVNLLASLGAFGGVKSAQAHIGEDRKFILRNVTPGSYKISTSGSAYVKSARFNDVELPGNRVDVPTTGGTLTVHLSMDSGSIEVGVQKANGEPASGAMILISPQPYVWSIAGHSGPQHLPPGDYEFFAFEDNSLEILAYDPAFYQLFEGKGVRVSLGRNDHQSITLKTISVEESNEALKRLR